MAQFRHFDPSLMTFLKLLQANNNRDWFNDHKQDYEDFVRTPALAFISEMDHWIRMISPSFEASPKKVGGSLMRVYRDTRFSKNKAPYKTNLGIQFRHENGKDIHAPGFYFHVDPEEIFIGAGVWHPASDALRSIRDHIVTKPAVYQDAIEHSPFAEKYQMVGDSLVRAPKGYEKEHPLIDEIKRKDFIALATLTEDELYQDGLCEKIASLYGRAQPLQRFLCDALQVRF